MANEPDHYAELGVAPKSTPEEIKSAYRKKALDCHPDRGGSERQMRRLNAAWNTLGDPEARRAYDAARITSRITLPAGPTAGVPRTIRRRDGGVERTIISDIGAVIMKVAFWVGQRIRACYALSAIKRPARASMRQAKATK